MQKAPCIALGKLIQDVSDKILESNKWYIEPKIDGVRALIFADGLIITRYGNELHLDKHFISAIKRVLDKDTVLDCEMFVKDVWQTISLKAKDVNPKLLLQTKVYVFDLIDEDTVRRCKTYQIPYEDRRKELSKIIDKLKDIDRRFVLVPSVLSPKSDRTFFTKQARVYYNKGFEGIMLKRHNHVYIPSRTSNWIKVKVFADIDAIVIDIEISNDRMKALVCKYNHHQFKVGTGFTETQRKIIAKYKDWFIGKKVNIKSQYYTNYGVPRIPVFVGFDSREFTEEQLRILEKYRLIKPTG